MNDIDLQKLKELAQKATPGPWTASGMESKSGNWSQNVWSGNKVICEMSNELFCTSRENAAYIAAASPDVVLDLIEQLESLQGIMTAAFQALGGNCTSTDVPADLPKRIREFVLRHNGLLCEKGDLSQEAHWLADLLVNLKICPTVKIYKCRYQEDKDFPHSECVKCWRKAARKTVGSQNDNNK